VDTKEVMEVKNREFRFEKLWLLHPDFHLRVEKAWNSPVSATDSISVI
jgi:hypothetical protein